MEQKWFLVDLGDEKFVVCEKHGIYSGHFRAITYPISGATWAADVLSDIVQNDNIHAKLSKLTRYHMRPYKR
jgi:hypothetical protein